MNEMSPERIRPTQPRALLENLFAFSPDAIVLVDRTGRIIEANPQVERLFGYLCSELLGSAVEILIPERFRQLHPAHRNGYHSEPKMRPMGAGLDLFGRRKDGSEFPVDIMLSPVETPEGVAILGPRLCSGTIAEN